MYILWTTMYILWTTMYILWTTMYIEGLVQMEFLAKTGLWKFCHGKIPIFRGLVVSVELVFNILKKILLEVSVVSN